MVTLRAKSHSNFTLTNGMFIFFIRVSICSTCCVLLMDDKCQTEYLICDTNTLDVF